MNEMMKNYLEKMENAKKSFDSCTEMADKEKFMAEYESAEKSFELEKKMHERAKANVGIGGMSLGNQSTEVETDTTNEKIKSGVLAGVTKKSVYEMADAMRKNYYAETTNSSADGGYLVPEDIKTAINYFKSDFTSLLPYISYEKVNTNKGSRTYQTKSTATKLTKLNPNETGAAAQANTPTFTRLNYNIDDYADVYIATNDLLADSPENIIANLARWYGQAATATDNYEIKTLIETKTATAFTGLDDIRTALNVTLGSAYKPTSIILTNDDGFNWLDIQKDSQNRPILNPDLTSPNTWKVRCGANMIPVVNIPNSIWASATGTGDYAGKTLYPFICGDLKEYARKWDRDTLEVLRSDVAVVGTGSSQINLFTQRMAGFRVSMRADYTTIDTGAIVRGFISI